MLSKNTYMKRDKIIAVINYATSDLKDTSGWSKRAKWITLPAILIFCSTCEQHNNLTVFNHGNLDRQTRTQGTMQRGENKETKTGNLSSKIAEKQSSENRQFLLPAHDWLDDDIVQTYNPFREHQHPSLLKEDPNNSGIMTWKIAYWLVKKF